MFWKLLRLSLALLLLSFSSVAAQTTIEQSPLSEQEKQQKAVEMKRELERKTLALLDEIIGSASTLKLPENRALVLSSAADLLWVRDEKRARTLFKDALNSLHTIALRPDEKMSDEQRRTYWLFEQQRKELLLMVARHDADLALELLRSSRSAAPNDQRDAASRTNDEEQLERSLAIQVAETDPKRAFQMAEDNLSKGLFFELLNFLNRLNDKDPELAIRFADDIINRLRSENLATNREAAFMAMVLVRTSVVQANVTFLAASSYPRPKTPFKLTERQLHDLLEMVTSASLTGSANLQHLLMLSYIMPEIKKQFPERAQALYSRIAEVTRNLAPDQRIYFENQELIQTGSVEALMEAAAKASSKTRDMLYEQAAWRAISKGDDERARRIVNDNIKDAASRDRLLESFDSYSLRNSIGKERLDEAREKISHLKSRDERAGILAQLAFGAAVKKDRKLALELLNDALPLVNFKPRNDAQLYLVLQVVKVYAMLEPARAFEMIESLVDQANELLTAASVLNGFLVPAGTFRKGELVLPIGYANVSQRFSDLGKQLAALALFNFERTKAAADKLQRNETRIMARLFIVQSVLSEQLGSSVPVYDGFVMAGN